MGSLGKRQQRASRKAADDTFLSWKLQDQEFKHLDPEETDDEHIADHKKRKHISLPASSKPKQYTGSSHNGVGTFQQGHRRFSESTGAHHQMSWRPLVTTAPAAAYQHRAANFVRTAQQGVGTSSAQPSSHAYNRAAPVPPRKKIRFDSALEWHQWHHQQQLPQQQHNHRYSHATPQFVRHASPHVEGEPASHAVSLEHDNGSTYHISPADAYQQPAAMRRALPPFAGRRSQHGHGALQHSAAAHRSWAAADTRDVDTRLATAAAQQQLQPGRHSGVGVSAAWQHAQNRPAHVREPFQRIRTDDRGAAADAPWHPTSIAASSHRAHPHVHNTTCPPASHGHAQNNEVIDLVDDDDNDDVDDYAAQQRKGVTVRKTGHPSKVDKATRRRFAQQHAAALAQSKGAVTDAQVAQLTSSLNGVSLRSFDEAMRELVTTLRSRGVEVEDHQRLNKLLQKLHDGYRLAVAK